jgi:DNA-binding XRE family transcriptional regulator
LNLEDIDSIDQASNFDLARKIKIARSCCALTQEQLANKIGVTRGAVAMWEAGTTMPSMNNLIRLGMATQRLNYLLGENIPTSKQTEVVNGWRCPNCTKIYSPVLTECPRC